jgi:hypothetical protein
VVPKKFHNADVLNGVKEEEIFHNLLAALHGFEPRYAAPEAFCRRHLSQK